jgi:hypothetical protein
MTRRHHQLRAVVLSLLGWDVICCGVLCCAGKRLVLAGAGLEHEQLVELATPMLKGKHMHPLAALCCKTGSHTCPVFDASHAQGLLFLD